jgi:hypothetical protein
MGDIDHRKRIDDTRGQPARAMPGAVASKRWDSTGFS